MSARSHRLRQEVHHGGLELWLIGMRLEGTETHADTPLKVNMKGWTHSITHKVRHRQRGLTHTHTHTHTHFHTQEHKQHLTHRKIPRVTRTQRLCAALKSLWDKRYLQQSDTQNRKHQEQLRLQELRH